MKTKFIFCWHIIIAFTTNKDLPSRPFDSYKICFFSFLSLLFFLSLCIVYLRNLESLAVGTVQLAHLALLGLWHIGDGLLVTDDIGTGDDRERR